MQSRHLRHLACTLLSSLHFWSCFFSPPGFFFFFHFSNSTLSKSMRVFQPSRSSARSQQTRTSPGVAGRDLRSAGSRSAHGGVLLSPLVLVFLWPSDAASGGAVNHDNDTALADGSKSRPRKQTRWSRGLEWRDALRPDLITRVFLSRRCELAAY